MQASSCEANAAAELTKYAKLPSLGEFFPTAAMSYGPINEILLVLERLLETTGDVRASVIVFVPIQQISVHGVATIYM